MDCEMRTCVSAVARTGFDAYEADFGWEELSKDLDDEDDGVPPENVMSWWDSHSKVGLSGSRVLRGRRCGYQMTTSTLAAGVSWFTCPVFVYSDVPDGEQ